MVSERGSFITEYIYCEKCFNAVREILLANGKFLQSVEIPHWNNKEGSTLPIIAGKIGGTYPGDELDTFMLEFIPKIKKVICHDVRIAVLGDSGEQIFKITPNYSFEMI